MYFVLQLIHAFHGMGAVLQNCPSGDCDLGKDLPSVGADSNQVANILQLVFMIIGVVALVYLIIAGVRLITSLGNPEALKDARQSIIFAAVGLAVSLSAELIVITVIKKL